MLFSGEIVFGISVSAIILISTYGGVELWRFNKRMKKELTSARFGSVLLGSSVSLLNLFNMTFSTRKTDPFILEDPILWFVMGTAIFIAVLAQIKAMKKLHRQLEKSYPEAFVS